MQDPQPQEQQPQARESRSINPTPELSEFFSIVSESENYYDRFVTNAREILLKFKQENITGDVINDLHACIENLFTYKTREYEPEDFIDITLSTVTLPQDPVYSFKKLRSYSSSEMWEMISSISQSACELKIDNTFKIKIIRV